MMFDAPAVLPALLTPFGNDGEVDTAALRDHVGFVIEAGVQGIMPCGTTGETALLEPEETLSVVRTVVEAAAGRVPVIAHVGRPSTRATARLIAAAVDAGAAGVSAIVPYYYAFGEREIVAHFRALLRAAGETPLYAYTFPARTGNAFSPEAFGALVADGLAGMKDSTSDDALHEAYLAAGPGRGGVRRLALAPAARAAGRLARRGRGARQPAARARAGAGGRVARRRRRRGGAPAGGGPRGRAGDQRRAAARWG